MRFFRLLRALYQGHFLQHLPDRSVGLFASGLTLMILGGLRPLFQRPEHWLLWVVWSVLAFSQLALVLLAGLSWRLYIQRLTANQP